MLKIIDNFLNSITMYRLILYFLLILLAIALSFSIFHLLPFSPLALIASITVLVIVSWCTNTVFATVFESPTNNESLYISALILALIITPPTGIHDYIFLAWAAILTMASKFIFAIGKKHLFNPVAIAVVITSLVINQTATWWVGNSIMFPFVLVGGLLIVRKIKRYRLIESFLVVALIETVFFAVSRGVSPFGGIKNLVIDTPILFFAFVMLTEPLTTPPTAKLQMMYGGLVGILFAPQIHLGPIFSTPELALIAGNLFSYLVSPKIKLVLNLTKEIQLSPDIYDFVFTPIQKISYEPGQYMEWTLEHDNPDDRGNRRYFTLASSPTEPDLRLGIKFYQNSSTYKKALLNMTIDSRIVAGQLAGDFTLPQDKTKKLVFIAGGIGITPFRSMVKYLIDKKEQRDITIFYASKTIDDVVYSDVFNQAQKVLGIKTIYVLSDGGTVPPGWTGKTGRIDAPLIQTEVPDYQNCYFYVSGPRSMIVTFEELLANMGVAKDHLKTDFFPGFA